MSMPEEDSADYPKILYKQDAQRPEPPVFRRQQDATNFNLRQDNLKSKLPMKQLWFWASVIIIALNLCIGLVVLRDMYSTKYDYMSHLYYTSAFTFTIGVLAFIHSYVIKKD